MKYRVQIYKDEDQLISDDFWYGNTIENMQFWVDKALLKIRNDLNCQNLKYEAFSEDGALVCTRNLQTILEEEEKIIRDNKWTEKIVFVFFILALITLGTTILFVMN